jgi:hypothetical protein
MVGIQEEDLLPVDNQEADNPIGVGPVVRDMAEEAIDDHIHAVHGY